MLDQARRTVDAILAAVLAPQCPVCARVSERPSGNAVCEACWSTVRVITPPFCHRCGDPLPARGIAEPHGPSPTHACLSAGALDRNRSLGAYDGTLRDLVHALKYAGRRSIAARLGRMMRERCGDVLEGADGVVPVPLHRRRHWSRGFNQAGELARSLGLPVFDVLRRTRRTLPQADLPATQRRENVHGAFAVRRLAWRHVRHVRGRCLVLVDDVTTTGATLEACAEVLKGGGVAEVRAITAARTLLAHGEGRVARRGAPAA